MSRTSTWVTRWSSWRVESLRRELLESVTAEDWELARTGFGDPDLATE